MVESRETERLRRFYDEYAEDYDWWMRFYDSLMLGDGRGRVCSRASGRTLELAIGTGLNLPFYSDGVHLTGVDLSPAMLAAAGRRARQLDINAELLLGDANALNFPNDRFDTVVATLFLSTVPDPRRATAGIGRVLKPGGRLLLLDHVRSPIRAARLVERLLDPPMRKFAGVHLLRNPLDYLGAVSLRVERCARSRWGIVLDVVARKGCCSHSGKPA